MSKQKARENIAKCLYFLYRKCDTLVTEYFLSCFLKPEKGKEIGPLFLLLALIPFKEKIEICIALLKIRHLL